MRHNHLDDANEHIQFTWRSALGQGISGSSQRDRREDSSRLLGGTVFCIMLLLNSSEQLHNVQACIMRTVNSCQQEQDKTKRFGMAISLLEQVPSTVKAAEHTLLNLEKALLIHHCLNHIIAWLLACLLACHQLASIATVPWVQSQNGMVQGVVEAFWAETTTLDHKDLVL